MIISAQVSNTQESHSVLVHTNGTQRSIGIPPKGNGYGSSVNGGELLMLALATCYCNDIYREAKKRDISISGVEVEVIGEFGAEGEPAKRIEYRAKVDSKASKEDVAALMEHTDTVAEVHNTLRKGCAVEYRPESS